MATKNYKEDLDFRVILKDKSGNELPLPWYDFRLVLRTDGCRAVTAWRKGEHWENCFADGGRIHVVMNGHGLGPGVLRMKMLADIPNSIYPDGAQLTVMPEETNIELVAGKGDWPDSVEVELTLSALSDDLCRILDEVNAQLERTLGGPIVLRRQVRATGGGDAPAVKTMAPYSLAEYVSRGMMPVEARPGVVYRVLDYRGRPVPGKYQTVGTDGEVVVLKGYFPVRKLAEPSQQEMERFIREGWNESHRLSKTGYYRFDGIAYEVQLRRSFTKDVWRDDRPVTKKYSKWCHTKKISNVGVIRVRRVPARASSVPPGGSCRSRSKASATEWRYFSILGGRHVKRL